MGHRRCREVEWFPGAGLIGLLKLNWMFSNGLILGSRILIALITLTILEIVLGVVVVGPT